MVVFFSERQQSALFLLFFLLLYQRSATVALGTELNDGRTGVCQRKWATRNPPAFNQHHLQEEAERKHCAWVNVKSIMDLEGWDSYTSITNAKQGK